MTTQTPIQRLERLFALQKAAFAQDMFPSAETRIERMSRIVPMMYSYRARIHEALVADFGSHSGAAADLTEILSMVERVRFDCANVQQWMKPIAKPVDPATQGESLAYVQYSPKGVVCNMAAWNFPSDVGIALMVDKGVAVNEPAPQVTAADRHGRPVNFGYAGEKAQLLFFLSPTCPICKSLLPAIKSIAKEQAQRLDVVFVSDGEPAASAGKTGAGNSVQLFPSSSERCNFVPK